MTSEAAVRYLLRLSAASPAVWSSLSAERCLPSAILPVLVPPLSAERCLSPALLPVLVPPLSAVHNHSSSEVTKTEWFPLHLPPSSSFIDAGRPDAPCVRPYGVDRTARRQLLR